jgi:hypothetical protein
MPEAIRNDTLTIDTTAVVVSEEKINSERTFISVINTSSGGQAVSVSFDAEAANGHGFVLYPGGSCHDNTQQGSKASQRVVTAISDLAGATIAIHERVQTRF